MKQMMRPGIRQVHRRLGKLVAVFFIFLACTGGLLNHSPALKLDQVHIPSFLAGAYMDDIAVPAGKEINGTWVYGLGGKLWFDEKPVAECYPALAGVLPGDGEIHALCGTTLLVLTQDARLVEEQPGWLGSSSADVFGALPDPARWSALVPIDTRLVQAHVPMVTWEKFILDIHSGAYFGGLGVFFLDMVALFVIVMAVSGLIMTRR